MITSYAFKLKPNKTQVKLMDSWLDMLRSSYNWSLSDRQTQYHQQYILGEYSDLITKATACPLTCCVIKCGATGEPWKNSKVDTHGKPKNPKRSASEIQITNLTNLKESRPWFKTIDSTVLQQNIRRLDAAYQKFFERGCIGFPKYKNRSNFTSFSYSVGVKVQVSKIYLPKIGWMNYFKSREIPNGFSVKTVTIRKRADGWFVSIRLEAQEVPNYSPKPLTEVKTLIGCDLGLKKLVHLSNSHQIENPKFSNNKKSKGLLKIRQRRIIRKKRGSCNQRKAVIKLGRFQRNIVDKRDAFQWKKACYLSKLNVDGLVFEDLNISGMMKRCQVKKDEKTGRFLKNGQSRKKGLNRAIADASWSSLLLKIEYMAAKSGKVFLRVTARNSSIECRACGHIDKSNRDGEKFICTKCGYFDHADIGASKTIRDRGYLKVLADCEKLVSGKKLNAHENISTLTLSKRTESGNLREQDIKAVMS